MNKPQQHPYATYLNVLFPGLSVIDVPSLVASCKDCWYNQTLLTRFINLLSLLLLVSISIKERIFTMALAFFTNQFAILFDDIPLSVAISTNHFNLLVGNVLG